MKYLFVSGPCDGQWLEARDRQIDVVVKRPAGSKVWAPGDETMTITYKAFALGRTYVFVPKFCKRHEVLDMLIAGYIPPHKAAEHVQFFTYPDERSMNGA